MLSSVLRHLVSENLTTVRELVELTGRGESTVYRWLKGTTQPSFDDMRRLVRHLPNLEGRRAIVGLFTLDAPISIEWLADKLQLAGEADDDPPPEAIDLSLLALECLSEVLAKERDAYHQNLMTEETGMLILKEIDSVIRYMSLCRAALARQMERRRPARRG